MVNLMFTGSLVIKASASEQMTKKAFDGKGTSNVVKQQKLNVPCLENPRPSSFSSPR